MNMLWIVLTAILSTFMCLFLWWKVHKIRQKQFYKIDMKIKGDVVTSEEYKWYRRHTHLRLSFFKSTQTKWNQIIDRHLNIIGSFKTDLIEFAKDIGIIRPPKLPKAKKASIPFKASDIVKFKPPERRVLITGEVLYTKKEDEEGTSD